MKTLTFQITEESYELLKNINKTPAEYRDPQYLTIEDFKKSYEYDKNIKSLEYFLNRNYNGTYYLIDELLKYGLVDIDEFSWHLTYKITEFGQEVLKFADV
jgi:predicted transcriptional regulator